MRRLVLLGMTIVASHAADPRALAQQEEAPSHGAEAHRPNAAGEQYVVLTPGALWREAPSISAPGYTTSPGTGLRLRGTPFALRSDRGEWLEVEPLPSDPKTRLCGLEPPRALAPLAIRVFVRRRDLLRVITRRLDFAFPDGTSAALAPGVTLERGLDDAHLVHALPFAAPSLRVPADAVGIAYRPAPLPDAPESAPGSLRDVSWSDVAAGAVRCGGAALTTRRAPSFKQAGTLRVTAERELAGAFLVRVREPCASLQVLVPGDRLREPGKPLGKLKLLGEKPKRPFARKGATVYFRSGQVAGAVRGDVGFLREVDPAHDRRCFVRGLFVREGSGRPFCDEPRCLLNLCFDRGDVQD